MPKAKYRPGPPIRSMASLSECLEAGVPVYWNLKCQNAAWLVSMTYRTLRNAVQAGILRHALPVEDF